MRKVWAKKVFSVVCLERGGWWQTLARFATEEEAKAYAASLPPDQGKVLVWEETTMFQD